MAAVSSDVNAGDDATAQQYNDLREDVLDPITGHKHDGSAGGGSALGSPLIPKSSDMVGDGSDGDVTINAPTTIENVKNFNNLTLNDIITPAAGKHFLLIRVKETLTINNGGGIDAIGFGAAGAASGANDGADGFTSNFEDLPSEDEGGAAAVPGDPGRPGAGQIAAAVDAGENIFIAYGAGGGGSTGGKGGKGWAGGGGGGGGTFAGGNGGGCIIIFANAIIVNAGGIIQADGDPGLGAGISGAGGGGGGLGYLAYRNLTNNGTISAVGGIGGGSGAEEGGVGSPGLIVQKVIPA